MDRPYFCAYHSYLEALEPLNDAEKGRLFVACLTYSMTGEVPQLSGNERFVFPSLRGQIDRGTRLVLQSLTASRPKTGARAAGLARSQKNPSTKENLLQNPKNPRLFLKTQKTHRFF